MVVQTLQICYCEIIFFRWTFNFVVFIHCSNDQYNLKPTNSSFHELVPRRPFMKFIADKIKLFHSTIYYILTNFNVACVAVHDEPMEDDAANLEPPGEDMPDAAPTQDGPGEVHVSHLQQ